MVDVYRNIYSKKVMQHFLHPKNMGEMENPDAEGRAGNPICGDMMTLQLKIKNDRIVDIKFRTFGCLPPRETVCSETGDWTSISNINIGDTVLNSKGVKTTVSKLFVRNYDGTMIRIIPFVSTFNSFTLTPEHPILCVKRSWLKSARRSSRKCKWLRFAHHELLSKKPRYVKAESLEPSDYLIFVPPKTTKDSQEFTSDLLRLVGYYLAEGYVAAKGNAVAFSFNRREISKIADLESLLLKFSKKIGKRTRENVTEIYICSRKLVKLLTSLAGKLATNKRLCDAIMQLPFSKQWEMIQTYMLGDGNVYKRRPKDSPTYRISTASHDLAIQLQEILARGGIFSSIKKSTRKRDIIQGRKVNSHPIYEISFKLDKKHKFVRYNGRYLLVPIKRIKRIPYSGKVFNFHVRGKPNTYLVKGFAVHNCAAAIATSSMITELAKGKTLSEAMKITRADVSKELGGLPPIKEHCSNLAADALHNAIENYLKSKSKANKKQKQIKTQKTKKKKAKEKQKKEKRT